MENLEGIGVETKGHQMFLLSKIYRDRKYREFNMFNMYATKTMDLLKNVVIYEQSKKVIEHWIRIWHGYCFTFSLDLTILMLITEYSRHYDYFE